MKKQKDYYVVYDEVAPMPAPEKVFALEVTRIDGTDAKSFIQAWSGMQQSIHRNAVSKGWWDKKKDIPTELLLLHAEVSEATEALRIGNKRDEHIPSFSGLEAELADVIIRIMDLAEGTGLRIAEAVITKHVYNIQRSYRHGGKLF